jgi:broad-specificity NMP kinase
MKLVILNGTIGVGKLTTSKKLADETDYPILHNHLTRDLAVNFFKPNSDAYTRLVWDIRLSVVSEMVGEGRPGLIWTALLSGSPAIRKLYDDLEEIVHKAGGEVYYVKLTCELEEQKRRVVSEDRKEHKKIVDVDEFEQRMKSIELFTATPPDRTIEIDSTHLTPEEVAKKIVAAFNLDEKNRELNIEKKLLDNPKGITFKPH